MTVRFPFTNFWMSLAGMVTVPARIRGTQDLRLKHTKRIVLTKGIMVKARDSNAIFGWVNRESEVLMPL